MDCILVLREYREEYAPTDTPSFLLTRRALWDHQAAADATKLYVHLPDQFLIRSIESPPYTHSREVLELWHDLVQLNTGLLTTHSFQPSVHSYSMGLTPSEEGMHLSKSYVTIESIPPPALAAMPGALQDSAHPLAA